MTEKQSDETSRPPGPSRIHQFAIFGPVLAAFGIVTLASAVAAYRFGEGVIHIEGQTFSDLTFFEVTGGAALSVLGAVFALAAAGVGAVGALVMAVIGASVGVFGLAIGAVVVIGVVTGPVLLVTVAAILIKRRFWPDVI